MTAAGQGEVASGTVAYARLLHVRRNPSLIGRTLAHYRVTAAIGAGGMGEVYRATDAKLARDVAIKVLPSEVARDPERLARFRREAQLLASLNHPGIAAIYGIEEAEGKPFLVLELVEGEDLAERLKRGPLPLAEALAVAKQIAEALEAAHEKGIVHRDLKPANIKVTPEGQVKVLDFGLAKAYVGDSTTGSSGDLSQSPTLAPHGTQAGVILGTAAYMAPEQARGRAVDARADVWAFGCVLFEMLTGRAPFGGDTLTDVIAAVVTKEPPWSSLPTFTPPAIRRLLERALRKERRERLRHIGDARLEIEDALRGGGETGAAPPLVRRASRRELAAWGVAALALTAAAAVATRGPGHGSAAARTYRFPVPSLGVDYKTAAISPDGRRLAYALRGQLWIRSLDEAEPVAIEGTSGASEPFWSPDSRSIGFFVRSPTGNTLRRVGVEGAPPATLAELPGGWASGSWSSSGAILVEITEIESGEGWYLLRPGSTSASSIRAFAVDRPVSPDRAAPHFLPDGQHFLFTHPIGNESLLQIGSIESAETRPLVRADSQSAYAAPGYLLYVRDGALLAQPFDAGALRVTGEPQRLLDDVHFFAPTGGAGFSASQEGTLVVHPRPRPSRLAWLDRDGREIGTLLDPALYGDVAFSPDGRQLAVGIIDSRSGAPDLWQVDLERRVASRLTSSPRGEFTPLYTPDGKSFAFSADWQGPPNVYVQDLAGGAARALVPFNRRQQYPCAWTPDGDRLLYLTYDPASGWDLWVTDRRGEKRERLLATRFDETAAALSPDGRQLAFVSNETGAGEVYLQSFPGGENRTRVSVAGGGFLRWRGDGRELFFVTRAGELMVVAASGSDPGPVTASVPRPLFRFDPSTFRDYDAAPDGQRFLFNVAEPGAATRPDEVIVEWTRLLRR